MELIDVLKKLAGYQGTSLAFQIEKHNAEVWAIARAKGKSPPAGNEEERKALEKARRKRAVDRARVKRQTARKETIRREMPSNLRN
jgi:hypothetical protein